MAYKFKPFTALFVYSLNNAFITRSMLIDQLSKSVILPCGEYEFSSTGWVNEKGKLTIFGNDDHLMIIYCYQYRDIPREVVTNRMAEEMAIWRQRTGYKRVSKKLKQEMRQKIQDEEMSKAYVKNLYIPVWFNLKQKLLIIDATKAEKVEEVLFQLRQDLKSFPVTPIVTHSEFGSTVTKWLTKSLPDELETNNSIEFTSGKSLIRYRDVKITPEIVNKGNKMKYRINKCGLIWKDKVRFTLNPNLCFTEVFFNRSVLKVQRDLPLNTRNNAFFLKQSEVLSELIGNVSRLFNGFA